jgi:voltage-gated potassium channel
MDQGRSAPHGASLALDRRLDSTARRLFVGGEVSVRRTLLFRSAILVLLYLLVVAVFWLDRDGLRDNADGNITFMDVVYFTMVSVTTVGYGDVVPVTTQARVIDALLVTPIRLIIWLTFVGTAYQLVLQRLIEDFRMHRLQSRLKDHVIICGYGHAGECVAAELVARGVDKRQILVVDTDRERLEAAAEHGHVGILSDARNEDTHHQAMLQTAQALFVCTNRDDTNVLIVLTARHLSANVRIVARVEDAENDKLMRHSGANATVMPSRVGGILMADSLQSSGLVAYVMDLISAEGKVKLVESEARPQDIGLLPTQVSDMLVVRVLRGVETYGFWQTEARIQTGDRLIVVSPTQDVGPGDTTAVT